MNTTDAYNLAVALLADHDLDDWSVTFDNAKRRFGVCRFGRREIGLSAPLVAINDERAVVDTILHEIAHALAGPGAGHGPKWRSIARSIGATPERCVDAAKVNTPPAKWIGICDHCGETVDRHRLTDRAKRTACYGCCQRHNGGRFDAAYKFRWVENTPTRI